MDTIIIASNNEHKIKEFKQIFSDYNVMSMADVGFYDDIIEDGETFEENSKIKTDTLSKFLKQKNLDYMVIGDDSGLMVEALNGEPGVYSARYAGEHTAKKNRDKVLKKLNGKQNRRAKFVCVLTLQKPDGKTIVARGEVEGEILTEEHGDTSFGYDCLFYSYELKKCFGECSHEEKNSVSHRGKAIKKLLELMGLEK